MFLISVRTVELMEIEILEDQPDVVTKEWLQENLDCWEEIKRPSGEDFEILEVLDEL